MKYIFPAGITAIVITVLVMHTVANLFVKKDERKKKQSVTGKSVELDEICTLLLQTVSEGKDLTENQVTRLEDFLSALLDEDLFYSGIKMENPDIPGIIMGLLGENNSGGTSTEQVFLRGRLYASLKFIDEIV